MDLVSSSLPSKQPNKFLFFLKMCAALVGGMTAFGLFVYGMGTATDYLGLHYGDEFAIGFVFFLVAVGTAALTTWGPQ